MSQTANGRAPIAIRTTVLAAILGLVATLITWAPPAVAAPSRCADLYNITKAPPPRSQLPGFSGKPSPQQPGRGYDYNNPGEAARNLQLPDPDELLEYGTDTSGKTPGSKEHVYAAWNRYVERKANELEKWQANPVGKKPSNPLPWQRWLNSYIPNQGNDSRGKAYEKLLVEDIGLGGNDWLCQESITGSDSNRKYDVVNHKEKIAYEFKSGSRHDAAQLKQDALLKQKTGYTVKYIFGRTPTRATVRALENAGIGWDVMKATPRVSNPGRPGGASANLMNPNPKVPSSGSLNDTAGRSGRNASQAREVAAVDEELERQSGRQGQALRRPGGIDWSTMQLNYVSESADGPGLDYAFAADDNPDEDENPSSGGLEAAQLTSDALFTWLALPASSFWVNLNPDQPDKVIDKSLASTDAGRVLLEADLQLKKSGTNLMNPDTPSGQKFWDSMRVNAKGEPCYPSFRTWIEPKPASVREDGGQLYILDAPMKVQIERMDIDTPGPGVACEATDEVLDYNLSMYQKYVVPKVEQAVNTAPEFADLRRVYHSRVAAEWIRQRNAAKPGAFDSIIGSGDVGRWPARTKWNPRDVYDEYVKDFKTVQFTVTRQVEQDGQPVTLTFEIGGGVDFGTSPREPVSKKKFESDYPDLPVTVDDSRNAAVDYADSNVTWLGGAAVPQRDPEPTPTPTPTPSATSTSAPEPTPTRTTQQPEPRPTTPPPPQAGDETLPDTGGPNGWPLPIGAGFVVAGALLLRRLRGSLE